MKKSNKNCHQKNRWEYTGSTREGKTEIPGKEEGRSRDYRGQELLRPGHRDESSAHDYRFAVLFRSPTAPQLDGTLPPGR